MLADLGPEQSQEQGREGGVEAEGLGVADQVTGEGADDGAGGPADEQQQPGPDEEISVQPPVVALGDGPGLVNDQLGGERPPPPRALEGRGRGQADRAVAEVEQDGGDDRGDQAAAGPEDRRHGELGRPGEGGHRHDHRGDPAHPGRAGQDPERHAEGQGRDPDRGGRPDAVQVGPPPRPGRVGVGQPLHTTLRPADAWCSPAAASRSPARTSRNPNACSDRRATRPTGDGQSNGSANRSRAA